MFYIGRDQEGQELLGLFANFFIFMQHQMHGRRDLILWRFAVIVDTAQKSFCDRFFAWLFHAKSQSLPLIKVEDMIQLFSMQRVRACH